MRVEPWCDSPQFLKELKHLYLEEGGDPLPIQSRRVHKSMLLLTVTGVNSIDEAEQLRGRILYLDREEVRLPRGVFFIQDLLGLDVIDHETGKNYGIVKNVIATGANDVYEIVNAAGDSFLFPAVDAMIEERNPAAGWIRVRPIPGIFDGEAVSDAD